MRTCVIFNPAARGNKARHFRRHLDEIASQCALKATAAAGDARRLAAEAVKDGFELIVAAGGDGTVNETLNGIGDVPDGFSKARLSVLPLGTVNVFARELKLPLKVTTAWEILQRGREVKIDLPRADFLADGAPRRQYFVQLAGAGLDARAIELTDWSLKKKIGPLAYVVAGLKALREKKPQITVCADGKKFSGELVLVGNGRYYGGSFKIFPKADLQNGLLDICVLPRADWATLICCAPKFLLRGNLLSGATSYFQIGQFELTSEAKAAFELDGEWVGHLPVTFSVEPGKLRVIAP